MDKTKIWQRIAGISVLTALIAFILPLTALAVEDVTNLEAEAGDQEVTLTWDAVTGAVSYKVYLGTESVGPNEAYNMETLDTDNDDSEYVVEDLDNGTEYFFSVTAVDSQGDESVNFSEEVSATPIATDAFQVTNISSQDSTTILISFSEAVVLPSQPATKFAVTYTFNDADLAIESVDFASGDQKTVVLKTAEQQEGGEYIVTIPASLVTQAGAEALADAEREQVVLGGSAAGGNDIIQLPSAPGAPKVVEAVATALDMVEITFTEAIKLPSSSPETAFTILDNNNPDQFLDVTKAEIDDNDPAKVVLTTSEQAATEYTVVVTRVTDMDDTSLDSDAATAEFAAFGGGSGDDTTAPENPINLKAMIDNLETLAVALTWGPSANSAGDLARYIIYIREGNGEYRRHGDVAATSAEAEAALKELITGLTPETTYSFKVTAADGVGNESTGIETTITLPETGPGLAFLAIGSLFGGRAFSRRRKR